MFKWDGSDVTEIISQSDIYGAKYNKKNYWVIRHTDPNSNITSEETCMIRNSKNSLPCLIDELKPVFGLQKIGTNWCVHKGKFKILYKIVKTPENYIKEESTLDKYEVTDNLFKMQIQEIYTFRELLGITCSYDSSIIVRTSRYGVYPVSYYEPNMQMEDTKVIPYLVLEKWFGDLSIDDVVKRLLSINNIDKMAVTVFNIRSSIEKVIEHVDRRLISYQSCIMNRVIQRLQTSLE